MKRSILVLLLVLLFALSVTGCHTVKGPRKIDNKSLEKIRIANRLSRAAEIYEELLTAPDSGIPDAMRKSASCIAILPEVLKGAFVVGGRYGRGVVSCKNERGRWSPPAFIQLSAASIGFQIGAEATDLVLFFVGEKARSTLLTSNIALGADITVAAGPVGRTAQGKHDLIATGIYSYAKAKGIFAGVSLEGAIIKPDYNANTLYYGTPITNRRILLEGDNLPLTAEAKKFISVLSVG